jgi:guanine deaminase
VENVGDGGGPFGALIVRDGVVLATGVNGVTTNNDPTAHAEVVAIRAACQTIGDFRLSGCVLVTSCEPCPLCLAAALWARVERVLYAADRHDAARGGFDDLAFYELFATPREEWPMAVTNVAVSAPAAPFAAWQAKPDRVDY